MVVLVYAIITMPVSILLFLTHFPPTWIKRLIYILVWSGIYISVEWILMAFGRISYQNGWKFWYSFYFDIGMFSIIALHQHRPFRAYIISLPIILFLIIYFEVPFKFGK